MRIIPLVRNDRIYSCNSYLILGDWNHIEDINTIIDPGTDAFVLDEIERLSTGFGKIAVEQIILTHNHFDHSGAVKEIKKRYNARVMAFSEGNGVDERLHDGQFIKAGDDFLEVLHTPNHSSDSICLYAPSEKALFAGDTQVRVRWPGELYSPEYVEALCRIAGKDILKIYSGHDAPILSECREILLTTLHNIQNTENIPIHERRC
ncbi:MAG: MBL fold metallo-hydrolase [Desulfuromonadales bacterium]|nr:MBL fold metallo-hydrolase [Desulfuromonadales bacterium]